MLVARKAIWSSLFFLLLSGQFVFPAAGMSACRVFIVCSYHPGYFWQADEIEGIKAALDGLDIIYDIYYLDSKFHQDEVWLRKKAEVCLQKIKRFKPDLVFTCDDNATKTVAKHFLRHDLPIVFLGLNGEPEEYGLVKPGHRRHPGFNVTGILERHYYQDATYLLQTILLANNLQEKFLYLLTDNSFTSTKLFDFLKREKWETPWKKKFLRQVETFAQYKRIFRQINHPGNVIFFYNLETLVDQKGNYVDVNKIIA